MKTKLLKLALCAMAALPIGAWADAIQVGNVTTWTFNNLTDVINTNQYITDDEGNNNLYANCKSGENSTIRTFTPTELATPETLTFGDGYIINVSKVLYINGIIRNPNNMPSGTTATTINGDYGQGFLAFDTPVAGTLYVYMKAATEASKNLRIYHSENTKDSKITAAVSNFPSSNSNALLEVSYSSSSAGTFFFGLTGGGANSSIYAARFVPATYSLTINAENGTVTKSPDAETYESGTEVTLTATPNNGYKFVSWTGVDSSDGATATVTMNADKNVTATFEKKVATTVWKFDQYVASAAIFKEAGVGASAGQYIDGLYFHSRDKKSDTHGIIAKLAKVTNADLNTHFGTYKMNNDYMGALIGTGGGTAPGESTEAGTSTTVDGVSYKAPAAGKFYATVVRSANTSVIVYKNGEVATQVTFSDETPARELEVEVAAGDNIYLISPLSGGKQFYLWNAGFVPSTDDAVTKTVNITEAGYATFSATQNYQWSTSTYPELKAYTVSAVDAAKATITEIAASEGYVTIPACTGVILKGDAGPYTFTSTKTAGEVGTNSLIANLADYILPANDGKNYNYTLAPGPKFMHVASTDPGILAAGKAFLRTTVNVGGGLARGLDLVFDEGETTGISEIEKLRNVGNEKFFDLQGRLVAQPTRGLYIVNGKKVIIK